MGAQGNRGISWTDATWNPIVGCSHVSAGCDHCWAERAARIHYRSGFISGWDGHVEIYPDRLDWPLHRPKPLKIAVALMGDLFHEQVPDVFIDKVFAVMACAHWHEFQLLTKRPQRMLEYLTGHAAGGRHIWSEGQQITMPRGMDKPNTGWPLLNCWLGVSVWNQAAADERIPPLLQTPAAVRFVSLEPLLGPIDLIRIKMGCGWDALSCACSPGSECGHAKIDWVIVGGESGPGARPLHPDWVREAREQCVAAAVPFHFKGWGEWAEVPAVSQTGDRVLMAIEDDSSPHMRPCVMRRIGRKRTGRLLDGCEWLQFPEVRS